MKRLFVMLGNACNIQCKYCMQRVLVNRSLERKIDPKIYQLIDSLGDIRVTFYGGEPLLYFPAIKEIMANRPHLNAGIISNGKALTPEMVNFINDHNMSLTISWDGKNVMETRGYDAIAKQKHLLYNIDRLGLSAVVSAYNEPLSILDAMQAFDNVYSLRNNHHIGINLDLIFDVGLPDKTLVKVDYGAVKKQVEQIFNESQKPQSNYVYKAYIGNMLETLKNGLPKDRAVCGNGYTVLNVDLSGKLYGCHNTSNPIGEVGGDIAGYIANLKAMDNTVERRKNICKDCTALPLCEGGCMLMDDGNLTEYCNLRRAVYGTVIECVMKEIQCRNTHH